MRKNPADVQKLDVNTDGDRVGVQKLDNDPIIGTVKQERAVTLRRSSAIAAEPWATNAAGPAGLPQIFRDCGELLQRRLQIVGNLPRDDLGRKVGALLQAVVLQPYCIGVRSPFLTGLLVTYV
jgi:hypothetical protein